MKTMNISLPDTLKHFVDNQVHSAGYSTASEYLRQLIREAQNRKAKGNLEELLLEGLNSGEATEMSREDWETLRRHARIVPKKKKKIE